jgi:hypothetical protein
MYDFYPMDHFKLSSLSFDFAACIMGFIANAIAADFAFACIIGCSRFGPQQSA